MGMTTMAGRPSSTRRSYIYLHPHTVEPATRFGVGASVRWRKQARTSYKLKLPRAAARAKDLQARHIVFCTSSNGALSAMAKDFFDEVKMHAKRQGLDHMDVSLLEKHSVSFTTRSSVTGVSACRVLQILACIRGAAGDERGRFDPMRCPDVSRVSGCSTFLRHQEPLKSRGFNGRRTEHQNGGGVPRLEEHPST